MGDHFRDSNELLSGLGGRGYPTLALEKDGRFMVMPLGHFLGKPDQFREALTEQLHGT